MNYFLILILIGVLLVIALVLILIDYLLGGSKEKQIIINDDQIIPVTSDDSLLNVLSEHKIFIPSACGGKATCGFCKFKLIEGGPEIRPTELPFLNAQERIDGIRLSCQVKVKDDMKIFIPPDLLGAQEFKAQVVNIEDLTYDIKLVRFKLIEPETMPFKPGQYAQIKVPGIDIIRAYSIASHTKHSSELEFIIRLVPNGQATTFVHKAMRLKDRITITGPYGDFFLQEDSNRDIICIAGGSGKAPIRSILYVLKDMNMPRKVKYFFGAKTKKDLYYTDEFKALEKEFTNFQYIPALSEPLIEDQWEGEVGLITDVVDRHVGDLSESEAYLCGSPGMIHACIKILYKHEMKQPNIYFDSFS